MLVSLSPELEATHLTWHSILGFPKGKIPNIHERSLPAEKMERIAARVTWIERTG